MTPAVDQVTAPALSADGGTVSWRAPNSEEPYTFERDTAGALLLTGTVSATKGSDAVPCQTGDTSILFSKELEVARDDRDGSRVILVGNVLIKSTVDESLALDMRFAIRDPYTFDELARSRASDGVHLQNPVRNAIIRAQMRGAASLTLIDHSCLLSATLCGFGVVSRLEERPNELLCGLSDAILTDKDSPPIVRATLKAPGYTWEPDSDDSDGEGNPLQGTQVEPDISQEVPVEVSVRLIR